MWICMNDAFLSIVNDPTDYRTLQVRARDRQHLVNFWKELKPKLGEAQFEALIASSIEHTPDRDYQWRSFVYREDVANIISNQILNIYYNNFKDSVEDYKLASAYSRVWSQMIVIDEPDRYGKIQGIASEELLKTYSGHHKTKSKKSKE